MGEMNKINIWLRWALCAFGLGLVVSLSAAAMVKAAVAGWVVPPPAVEWGVAVGLVLSWLCIVVGIGLFVRGLMAKAKG